MGNILQPIYSNLGQDLPGIGWIIVMLFLLLPVPVLNYRGRLYFLKITILSLLSPIIGPNFQIHWFTEQLVSLKQPFQDFSYTLNYYFVDRNASYDNAIVAGTFIGISLFAWRILQNIR